MDNGVKLQKYLADAGVGSRRRCEKIIEQGRVLVGGRPASIGLRVDPKRDKILLDGRPVVPASGPKTYIMLNKPPRVLTAMKDDRGRKTVADLIKGVGTRLFPVGRLDYHSSGLLLLTDDGEFAYALTHPSHMVNKGYEVEVSGRVLADKLLRLSSPFMLDGRRTAPAAISIIEEREGSTLLYIIIHEGRNRQIRRMCEETGLFVTNLRRVQVGDLMLGDLRQGSFRSLSRGEVDALKKMARPPKEKEKND